MSWTNSLGSEEMEGSSIEGALRDVNELLLAEDAWRPKRLVVFLDLNGVLCRCPPQAGRLRRGSQAVEEIRRDCGNHGIASWAYARPKEVRELVDFLIAKLPGQWGVYTTMTRFNAYGVLRDLLKCASLPLRETDYWREPMTSLKRPGRALEFQHPDGDQELPSHMCFIVFLF